LPQALPAVQTLQQVFFGATTGGVTFFGTTTGGVTFFGVTVTGGTTAFLGATGGAHMAMVLYLTVLLRQPSLQITDPSHQSAPALQLTPPCPEQAPEIAFTLNAGTIKTTAKKMAAISL
jgi:hypothetical protein